MTGGVWVTSGKHSDSSTEPSFFSRLRPMHIGGQVFMPMHMVWELVLHWMDVAMMDVHRDDGAFDSDSECGEYD